MTIKVFVDGQEGTTGLQIHERLGRRADIEVLAIDPQRRKEAASRAELLNACDVAFLCLPDDASREAAVLTTNPKTKLIDASTAHRTDPAWTYGLPELDSAQRAKLRAAKRLSVPGCHASGFVLIVRPLVDAGILPRDYPLTCHSLSGYSGAGKKLIAVHEGPRTRQDKLHAPRPYALTLKHKHLPEMHKHTGLAGPPLFMPVVGDYYQCMAVSVPLLPRLLARKVSTRDVHQALTERYQGERFVKVLPLDSDAVLDGGFLDPMACNGSNRLDLIVFGNDDQLLVVARFDNLGKGASGAAVQSMNVMLGLDEGLGLECA
jgi:N-acetyl-gamma-glutamyl-phosphate reductase